MKFLVSWNGLQRLVSLQVQRCYKRAFTVYLWQSDFEHGNYNNVDFSHSIGNPLLAEVSNLAFGHGYSVVSTTKQSLLVSGVNSTSQLGIPSNEISYLSSPKEVKLPLVNSGSKILDLSCGRQHTIVLTSEGLFASGCNRLGQCGLGNLKETNHFIKIPMPKQNFIKQVLCGLDHSLLLMHDGNVWSCGWGADGQTGLRHTDEQTTFAPLETLKDVEITKIASKADTSLALSNCGNVYAWGNSEYTQVGFATNKTLISEPTKIPELENVVDIAIGGSVGMALTGDGEVLSWGYGLLGNSPDVSFSATPQKVINIDQDVASIDCGLDFYAILTERKKLYTWGKIGRYKISRTPTQISLPTKVFRVTCGIHEIGFIAEESNIIH